MARLTPRHSETLTGLSTVRAYREQVRRSPIVQIKSMSSMLCIGSIYQEQRESTGRGKSGILHDDRDSTVQTGSHVQTILTNLFLNRWLGLRLDLLGNILVFGIALFAVGFRNTIDPSKVGVVLSYTLTSESD